MAERRMGALGGLVILFFWMLLCLFLGSTGLYPDLFFSYLKRPLLLFLNFLPILITYLLGIVLLGRARRGFALAAVLWTVAALAFNIKIRYRHEPLTLADRDLLLPMLKIAPQYMKEVGIWVIGGLVVALLLVFLVARLYPSVPVSWQGRGKLFLATLLLALAALPAFLSDDLIKTPQMGLPELNGSIEVRAAMRAGYLYSVVHQSAPYFVPTSPRLVREGKDILASYPESHPPKEARYHIIVVLLESYKDFSRTAGMPATVHDPYWALHELETRSMKGQLIADVYGGGSVHTELGVLGGYQGKTDPGIFREPRSSYPQTFRRIGYHTEAMHPNTGTFYNRVNLWPQLGFEDFLTQESYFHYDNNAEGIYPDRRLFAEVGKRLEALKKKGPSFQMVTTLQNHGPYFSELYTEPYFPYEKGMDKEAYNRVNNYLAGAQDTAEALLGFTETLEQNQAPVILVAFGDHSPAFDDPMNAIMGLQLDENTEAGYRERFETPCLIWANSAAKEASGKSFTEPIGDIDPSLLLAKLFSYMGWQGDRYQNYLQDALTHMSVDKEGFHIVKGHYKRKLSHKEAHLHDERIATEAAARTTVLGGDD